MASEDVIRINDRWYVPASAAQAEHRTRVLKQDELFGVFDRNGDIQRIGIGEQGLYLGGTRFLSRLELQVNNRRPLLLNSTVKEDNSLLVADMTTPDLYEGNDLVLGKGHLHIFRSKLLWSDVHYEHFRLDYYGERPVCVTLSLDLGVDFADVFEVRGVPRTGRGEYLPTRREGMEIEQGYRGRDGVMRRTRIIFSRLPDLAEENRAVFEFQLMPGDKGELYLAVACAGDSTPQVPVPYAEALVCRQRALREAHEHVGVVITRNGQFNDWLRRSAADLHMLTTALADGPYPYAGVPWFCVPFGRDGIITALQYLWLNPGLARGVLTFLAATQARDEEPERDAEPGKILHEIRQGEMVALGEVPFERYYGSVDATPLFIVLAGAYYERTGDRMFIKSIWPNIRRALAWLDEYGDRDGDGFVEYLRKSAHGLVNQGWKDSDKAVFHRDGTMAQGPIALCEVQGYVYQAKQTAARLAALFGEAKLETELVHQANKLRACFNEVFWCDELSTYALALDGDKRLCRVATSNAGHALFSGIAGDECARRLVNTLLSDDSFSGWGIRTLARGERRYNPMSYHNGSVWPHDNAMVGLGFDRYGYKQEALRIMTGLFEATLDLDLHRLPELFCGFDRLPEQGITRYPVACSPQAWASGAVFQLLQACLGLIFSAENPRIRFSNPRLPDYLDHLEIKNLCFDDGVVDIDLHRDGRDVRIDVTRREGNIDVVRL